jgi:hypothetical protein
MSYNCEIVLILNKNEVKCYPQVHDGNKSVVRIAV